MNAQQYTSIFNRYRPAVLNHCKSRLRHCQDAEDLTNTIFAKLWCNRKIIRLETIESYLKKVTRNACIDVFKHRQSVVDKYQLSGLDNEYEDRTEERLFLKSIEKVIYSLPCQQRRLIRLKYFEGFEPSEISTMLGISNTSVRNQLCTGLNNIRKRLAAGNF